MGRVEPWEATFNYLQSTSAKPSEALLTSEVICPWGTSSGSSSLEEKARKEPGTGAVYLGHLCIASV